MMGCLKGDIRGRWLILIFAGLAPSVVLGQVGATNPTAAPKPAISPQNVKQLFVPAHRPKDWPAGDWELLSTQEYRRLLEGLQSKPALPEQIVIPKARYQAVFTGENLSAGRLLFEIQRSGGDRLLSLEPLNFAVTSLWWSQAEQAVPAAWGNAPGGRTLLVLPPSGSRNTLELQGEWQAKGRRMSERVEFDLKFAPAVVTELELYLPQGWALSSSHGQVQGPLPISERSNSFGNPLDGRAGLRLWRVLLGSETACELRLNQQRRQPPARPLLLAEADTTYLIREQELQIESRYELEAVFAPISQLVFQVPRSIHIYAVSYGGDLNVNWRMRSQANQQQLVIDFPDPLQGRSRPIRIQGLARVQPNRAWPLPRVTCPEAALLRGELHLTVESPLELRSYELRGFRQTAISVQSDQRETLTFSQMAADRASQLTASVGTPAYSASAQVVSHVTTGTEEWQMRTEVTWVTQSGSRYVAVCEVLPGWEILDVRRPGESSQPVISQWRLSPRGHRLSIEFLDALTPQQTKRVQILARRLPLSSDQSMSLAPVQPMAARSVEQFLAVHSQKGDVLVPNSSAEIWTRAGGFPGFVQNSSLLPAFDSQGSTNEVQYFVSKGFPSDASLTLRRSAPPYNAAVNMLVNLTNHEIQETLAMTIDPLEGPIDRLTLLAPPWGEGWTWELLSGDAPPAALNAPDSAADNGVSEASPIPWDLPLPASQSKRFQIVARRRGETLPLHGIVLPHLPQARDFQGTVEISGPSGALLDVETRFTTEEQGLPEGQPTTETEVLRRWHYQSPDATLSVAMLPQNAAPRSLLGRLRLLSVINGYSQSNLHRAHYELESSPEHVGFSFRLPESVRLIDVRLNGEKVSPSRSEQEYVLHYLPPEQKNRIEISYQQDWEAGGITANCTVPMPRTDIAILGVDWKFAVSPNLTLSRPPAGVALKTSASSLSWSTRFFGPLGQRSRDNVFRPWDWAAWQALIDSPPREADPATEATADKFLPSGWTIHEAQGPGPAEDLSLALWNHDLVNPLAWVAFLVSLAGGVLFRLLGMAYRRHLGLTWLLLNIAGAGLLPMPWAIFCGGSVAGTLIALLLPRRFLKSRPPVPNAVPLGSTASFQHHPAVSMLLLAGLGWFLWNPLGAPRHSHLWAQTIPPPPESSPADEIQQALEFHVLVPVDDPQNPRTVSDVVYINRKLLEHLRSSQPKPPREETYLISSAKYDLAINSAGSVELTAEFLVTILTPQKPVKIALPIKNAYLGGPGSCLVDGVSHADFSVPNFPGYVLELAPEAPKGPAVAEKDTAGPRAAPVTTRRIELRLHGDAAGLSGGGGRFAFSVPAVSASELTATLSEAYASLQLMGTQGKILSSATGKRLRGTLGTSAQLDLIWSHKPNGLPRPIKMSPAVSALAVIHPFWIEWQIRVRDLPASASPLVPVMLPRDTVVRAVKADRLESFRMRAQSAGTRLMMEFSEPPSEEFSVEIQCRTPRDLPPAAESREVRLPPLDLFAGWKDSESLEAEYHLGVNATPELVIAPPDPAATANDFTIVPPERFISTYRLTPSETLAIRAPQLAWKVSAPGELMLPIQPRVHAKRAWLVQEGELTERDIQWGISAEIETTGAKAFRHVFRVPESFLIDSVSVIEDETERLVRWTQTGENLELVLSDGTTGIQNVSITGWLPFLPREGNRRDLPWVQVEDAEIADSRLRLFQSRTLNHHIRVAGIEDLVQLEDQASFPETNGRYLLAGVRLGEPARGLSIEVGAAIQPHHLEKAIVIEPQTASRTRVTTFLRLLNSEVSRQNLQVRLPAALTREFRVESAAESDRIVPYETLPNADGSLDLVFHPADGQAALQTLKIESVIETASAERAELFSVEAIQGQVDASFLIIAPEWAVQPLDNAELPEAVSLENLPDWLQKTETFPEPFSAFRLSRLLGPSWKIVPARTWEAGSAGQSTVQTTVWLTDAETVFGRTVLELPRQDLQSADWLWPSGTSLEVALLDGRDLSPVIDEENERLLLLLPSRTEIQAPESSRRLELYWSRKADVRLPRFGRLEFQVPKPSDIPIHEARLEVIPAAYGRLIPQEGLVLADESPTAFRSLKAGAITGRLADEDSEWDILLWMMDSRTERVLLVALLILVLGGVTHWGLRFNIGDWLHRHPGVAIGGLGLLWWTCFAGSVFGFLLLLLSPVVALSQRRHPENPTSVPSEL